MSAPRRKLTPQLFLRDLLQVAPDARAWITTFTDPPKSGGAQWEGHLYDPRTPLLINGCNSFYSVAAFPVDAGRRTQEYSLGMAVVLCEDVGTKVDPDAVVAALDEPSYRIETSPGNAQWGYFLTRLADQDEARAILDALKAGGYTDPDGTTAVRYGRLPAGVNNKPEYEEPFKVRLCGYVPARRLDPTAVMTKLGSKARRKPATIEVAKSKVNPDDLRAALAFLDNDFGYNTWVKFGLAIKFELGDEGEDEWMKFSAKYTGQGYSETTARDKWSGFKPDGQVTGLSILDLAYQRGWEGKRDSWREPQNLLTEFTAPPYRGSDLPKVLGDFVDEFSKASGIDTSILAVSALVSAASMIDDRWRLYLGSTNWFESARLWAVTIAPPGSGKTPGQDEALAPLKERHSELIAAWRSTVEGLGDEDQRPPLPRLFVTDTTVEALSEVLRDNPRGVLIHYDELVSMLGSFDAYRGGGVSKDRGEYLKLFQGGPNQIERIKRGMVFVPNWGASILAGTTPSALVKLSAKLPNDGLLQRFLIAIGRRKRRLSYDMPPVHSLEAYKRTLLRVLRKETDGTPTVIHMAKEALAVFREWEATSGLRTEAAATMSEGYESHVSKHAQMVARIALVFHFVETADLDDVPPLSEGAMRLAIKFLEKADLHAMVLYTSLLHSGGPITLAREVARMILSRQCDTVQRRQLTAGVLAFRDADDHARDRAMRLLDDYGWVRPAKGKYDTGHTTRWDVNPAVATLFAAEAERERSRRAMIVEKIAATSEGRRREAE